MALELERGLLLLTLIGFLTLCITISEQSLNSDTKAEHNSKPENEDFLKGLPEGTSLFRNEEPDDKENVEWVVKLGTIRTLWSWESNDVRADRLAEELGLKNLGRVEPFPDVYRFQGVWSGSSLGEAGIVKRDVEEVEVSLTNHESLMWATREVEVVRRKRSNYLNLNDPMFSKQWHLVS